MNVLIAEDNNLLRHHLVERLTGSGYQVLAAGDGREAQHLSREYTVEIAIIDLGLPAMDGFELIRSIRTDGKAFPILVLTARGNWQDKVEALQLGADDYVVKPFQFEELEARLNALLRRAAGFTRPRIEAGVFALDLNRRQAFVANELVALTAFEYRVLEYLMLHHKQTVSKEKLLVQLYGPDEERDDNVIEVLVGRLRRKLEAASGINPITTVRSRGYLFDVPCH
ncbi:MAG: response regulator [Porticoccaceae bacterium]|jgi:two-component system response regulator PhoP